MNFDVACLMKFHDFPFEYSSLHSLSWKSFVLASRTFLTWVENILITSFAFSTQHCEIKFHSYGYTVKDYTLMWDRDVDGKVKKGPLAHLWEPKRTLGLSLYLGFVDLFQRFDKPTSFRLRPATATASLWTSTLSSWATMMSLTWVRLPRWPQKKIAHFRRVCPGRREWRRDARAEAQAGPEAHCQLFHCPGM